MFGAALRLKPGGAGVGQFAAAAEVWRLKSDVKHFAKQYGCFQKIGVKPPKWMVYNGKPY